MPIKISLFALVLIGLALASFAFKKKSASSDLTGFWVVDALNSGEYQVKVFEESGAFYNLYFNNGESVITHKGRYDVIDKGHYREKVTDLRSNAVYDLLNKEFINTYELSSDKNRLVLSGVVVSKNGIDNLKWSHTYKRVSIPH